FRRSKVISPDPKGSPTPAQLPAPTPVLLTPLLSYPEAIDAMHAATQHGNVDIVRLLTQYPLVNYISPNSGRTPISTAAFHGRVDVVRLLLAAGANPVLVNRDGTTAVHIAAGHGDARIFQELELFSGQVFDDSRGSGRGKLLLAAV